MARKEIILNLLFVVPSLCLAQSRVGYADDDLFSLVPFSFWKIWKYKNKSISLPCVTENRTRYYGRPIYIHKYDIV